MQLYNNRITMTEIVWQNSGSTLQTNKVQQLVGNAQGYEVLIVEANLSNAQEYSASFNRQPLAKYSRKLVISKYKQH